MDGPQAPEVEAQGQAAQPAEPLLPFGVMGREGAERGLVVADVLLRMLAQRPAVGTAGVEPQGVALMVAEDGQGVARLDHAPHRVQDLPDLRPPVEVVAQEQGLASLGVAAAGAMAAVAEFVQQAHQLAVVAVDAGDDVVAVVHDSDGAGSGSAARAFFQATSSAAA